MKIKLKEIAELVSGKLIGDENAEIKAVAKISEARKGDLTFLYLPAYAKFLESTHATAVLINPDIPKTNAGLTYIEVANPNHALQKIIVRYFQYRPDISGIDPTASIGNGSVYGNNCAIGKNVVIGNNVIIGNNSVIMHNTVILDDCRIGDDTLIYPNVTIREKSEIGSRVILHSGTVIGSDGFGYIPNEKGEYSKVPQIGNVVIEDDVELGSNVSVDRAALGSTIIRKGTKIDNLVQVAHNVEIGAHTALSAQTGIAGSSKVGSHVVMGGQVGVSGHIEIADGVMIGAQSGVSKSLKSAGKYFGSPAKDIGVSLRLEGHIRSLPEYLERIKTLEKKLAELEKIIGKD
ncbi:MAG: UDP-3-O-(3-hydroxymyristoyl)glucosamine N-acyltransferase [Ignavibacteriales bacterium]|nr:UDP-3-O-(3-hydroxymyristoyl)glucosamine N-acyltransferase [Ignavibacteriales bacterium]MCF8314859.1 UDP-3-O-(3-hydroxymyristoyl)glucosamine N-acyltransferase [Ignavibacteriales bacterium]MCF8436192.1 UDP-3-O-(3-hydroxymyristoyl)glucosamine N-acyltransferase [Ignavibacteriales bacterium]